MSTAIDLIFPATQSISKGIKGIKRKSERLHNNALTLWFAGLQECCACSYVVDDESEDVDAQMNRKGGKVLLFSRGAARYSSKRSCDTEYL